MKQMNYKNKRVVVTGMGAITCLSSSVSTLWNNLINGESGIDFLKSVETENYSCKIGGEIKNFSPEDYIDKKESRRLARFSQLAVAATKNALEDSQIDITKEDQYKIGVLIGCGSGGLPETEKQSKILFQRGGNPISPLYVPMMLPNMAAANISRIFQLKGYSNTCITACAAGTQAIGEAYEVIKRGTANIMVSGGTEAPFCQISLGGFCNMHALTSQNEIPEKASKPFDAKRDGFVPSEGSGILILEEYEHALNRNAPILCEIKGWGVTSDAFHLVQPEKEGLGAAKCMNFALENAGLNIDEIDYINAHGTSTPANDYAETLAIKKVFGEKAYEIPISSTKSMVGHASGGAGAIEAIACVKSLQENKIHPTINNNTPDPLCDLDYTPNKSRSINVKNVLSNSFGFGGQNACLILQDCN